MKTTKKKRKNEVNFCSTSMVDLMFTMFIFFILVSTIKKDSIDIKAAKVNKSSQSSSSNQKTEKHVITIDGKNQIFVNGKRIEEAELRSALTEVKDKMPADTVPVIILRPDASSQSVKLIEIFAVLNEVGLNQKVQCEVESK